MKLSDYKDEEALDLLADLLEPVADIFRDTEIAEIVRKNEAPIKAVKLAIKNHKQSVIQIMAILDGVPVEDYHCNLFTLPIKLLEILNDKPMLQLFTSASQMTDSESSGSPTEITGAKEK